ncbi:MAG: phosphonate C-P lyase system protein PhnG [Telmatospirillum sp.]|nr:phosphonate C-P lyase system protein PhnG [Telmatospirillum sp.]
MKDRTDPPHSGQQDRRHWMGVLAKAPLDRLEAAWSALPEPPDFIRLRAPEIGSALVRARAGGGGQRFNLGEMTITRCSVRISGGAVGHAYVAGRRPRHAELAALFDALLQDPDHGAGLRAHLIDPLAADQERATTDRAARIATTKVDFFTLVRGED